MRTLPCSRVSDKLRPIYLPVTGTCIVAAAVGYGIGFSTTFGAAAVLLALPSLCLLSRQRSVWRACCVALIAALAMYVPLLAFFVKIFGAFALLLWLIAALPIVVFILLLNLAHRRLGPVWAMCLTPVLWTGIEYFRSEMWYLRFPWLLPGQAAALLPGVRLAAIGVYGLGFIYMALAALAIGPNRGARMAGIFGLLAAAVLMYIPDLPLVLANSESTLQVAGIQAEEWKPTALAEAVDHLATTHPNAQLLVLSEGAFYGHVPQEVREVVKKHQRYLIAGGRNYVGPHTFYNTAYVVGPDGEDVFSQVKSVPVQFMNDGIPATEQNTWESPWGKIGIAICDDAGYSRVMDELVKQGACGLIVPTMDATDWGEFERRMLHSRVAPIRSAEYGVPSFGVWSSGISQLVDCHGRIVASAGYPGQGRTITGTFDLSHAGRVPPDRPFAIATTILTVVFVGYLAIDQVRRARNGRRPQMHG